ncbi:MAG TPA: PQQ-binding-like beta-propeller repeat protein [Gemmataceae bacterium]|nr:PQQ-binding-like beta-propeller repeat protein [Gemmataceae bacterium]
MIPRFVTLASLLLMVASVTAAGDWPLHRGNAVQTGVTDEKLPDKLAVRWEFKTKDTIEATPIIVDGVVYIGSYDKAFYAIDLKTGLEKWKAQLSDAKRGAPIKAPAGYKDGRIYVGDADGKVYCLDAAKGSVLWTFDDDMQTGEITAAPNFAGDLILIPTHNSSLYAISKEGKKVWEFKIEGPIYGGVAVADGYTFLAGCDSLMHVIDVKDGKELGNVDLKGQCGSAAAVLGDRLYVGTMSNQVLSVNVKKLKVEWEFESQKRKQAFYGSAAVTNDLVIIGSRDNKVWAIDRKTGKERWSFITDNKVDASPVVAGNKVYVGSFDKKLYVLDLKGQKVEDFELDSAILGSPAVADGCVVVGSEKGTLYCFGAK